MIPSDRRPDIEAPLDEESLDRQSTLPPPVVATFRAVSRKVPAIEPLPRSTESRADEAWLRARVAQARESGDAGALRSSCATLARWLGSRDRDLAEAVDLANTALELGEGVELGRELSAWLESLGETKRAAEAMQTVALERDLEPGDTSFALVRAGLLLARASDTAAAASSFDAALRAEGSDALPAELLGAARTWQRDEPSLEGAADAYVEAALRRAAGWQHEAEMEDRWRAIAAAPRSESAHRTLAETLERCGRIAASDDVLRELAIGLTDALPDRAAEIHAYRVAVASSAGDAPRALSAALDEAAILAARIDGDALAEFLRDAGTPDSIVASLADALLLDRQSGAIQIERIAAFSGAPVRGLLLCHAVERYAAAGDALAARRAARRAAQADPCSVRALTTLAKMTSGEIDRTAVAILERAIAVVGPRMSWCTALVEALEALGDTELAATWSERCVSLCPSDIPGLVKHLNRLVRTADTGRLADALAWVLLRPLPRQAIAEPFTDALWELSRLDAAQGAIVARRALDVLGPKDPLIREAMLFAATTACDDAFLVAIFERALACESAAADREKLLVGLAELYERVDDDDAEARVTARAMLEGVRSPAIEAHVKRLEGRPGSPDARIWRLQAQAMDLSSADDTAAVALAWRRLGAALWDMAEDQAGALAAWHKAASIAAASGGYAAFAADLVTFAGESFATAHLTRLVESESDAPTAAAMAAEVARAALLYGAPRTALDLAALGVARHPASADALEAAEAGALQLRDFATLSGLYDRVAQKALGRFGDRAAHYRAARFFERIAEASFALKHAISAFRAMPSDGSVFRLLARAGERSTDRREAVRALEHAAAAARSSAMRAEWLLRAAALTSDDVEGRRQRIDLMLRAVVTQPDASTVESLAKAVTDSLGREPEGREDIELRVLHAAHSVASSVAGPQGARVAIAFAALALDPLGIVDAALELTVRAFDCDMSVDEFGRLHAAASALARAHGIKECLDELISKVAPPSHAGVSGLRLVEKIAKATADARLVARVDRELRTKDAATDLATPTSRPASIDEVATPQVRADRWTEIAERREARGDLEGAVRAQTEACKLDSETLGRWSVLERLAENAEDAESRVLALENIASRVGDDGRIPVFKRLARAHRDRRDFRAAERAWRSVLALDSADDDADQAIESIFVATARYSELAAHLAARARQIQADPTRVESLRAIRLRRAAILEQRLGLLDEACQELEHVLSDAPDNPSALRYLADLLERKGARGRAAELWARAAVVERDTEERDDLNLRAGRAAAATGDFTQAFGHAERVLSRSPENRAAHDLRCEAARSLGWDEELGDALERSAVALDLSSERKSELLVDASLASARAGDLDTALVRAALAANAAPEHATAQLLARGLEYRLRGPGTEEQARMTVEELGRLDGPLGDDDVALQAFLLAEALDVFHKDGSGLRHLEEAEQMTGHHALLSLGIAERLAADGQAAEALDAYRQALKGPLLGLRPVANVALSAVDAALQAGRTRDAMEFLDIAERYPDGKEAAIARRRQLAPSLSQEPASGSRPKSAGSSRPAPFVPARRGMARVALAKERVILGDVKDAERLLRNALADGFVDAGDELVSLLRTLPERNAEIAQVRRVQVSIEPGQRGRMDALHAAVVADGDERYALAIEHVLRAFAPVSERLPAPSLFSQPVQSGVLALLTRPSTDDVGEALALIWEGASQVFLRDATSYGITGLERIVPGPTSPLSKLYDGVIRVLQAPRIPLFAPKSETEPPRAHVALLSPPSVILTGDSRQDVAEVRFELGRGISAALPQHVLLMGLSASEGQTLIDALLAGFGPPDSSRGITPAAARMAEIFWQRLPARAQRRLQQILGSGVQFDYAALRARADQSGRRVGMFLAGDFGLAARVLVAERSPDALVSAGAPSFETLRELCQTVPDLADLFRLAVSPEYADARWHEEATLARSPSGRFTLL